MTSPISRAMRAVEHIPARCDDTLIVRRRERRCDLPLGHPGMHTINDPAGHPWYRWSAR
jgi:hypothetical protein